MPSNAESSGAFARRTLASRWLGGRQLAPLQHRFSLRRDLRDVHSGGAPSGTVASTQVAYFNHLSVSSPEVTHGWARVDVTSQGNEVYAYAMLIDNVSGDPIFMHP